MHILVIDDEHVIGDALEIMLNWQHHTATVIGVIDDEESFRLELDEIQPDGVILDFGMKHEGDNIYRWIKEWSTRRNKEVRIVFYTCYAKSPDLVRRMRTAGAAEHEIVKKREVGNDLPELLTVLT